MKRSRVRVTIEGQCFLLKISLQIKRFDFLLNSQNHVWLTSFQAYFWIPEKYIVKLLENRPQSSKNTKKWIKNCKIYDVDKSTLLFGFNSFFVFHSWALHRKHKTRLTESVKMRQYLSPVLLRCWAVVSFLLRYQAAGLLICWADAPFFLVSFRPARLPCCWEAEVLRC